MAFDPNNASIISNVVAGTGVTVTHTQVGGVDTFTAQIDQTWLSNYITTNVGGSLTLSAADEARIAALEAAIGTAAPSTDSDGSGLVEGAPATSTPAGTNGTTTIGASMTNASLSDDATITYKLIGIDGNALAEEGLFIADGNTPNSIAWGLWANLSRNSAMNKIWDIIEVTDDLVVITWKPPHIGSTMKVTINTSNAADGLGFTVSDY